MKEFMGCQGAWVHHKPHGYQHCVGGWIQSEKGKICDVAGLDVGREAAFANASLIAAAPDLLEALQLAFADMSGGMKSCGHNGYACTCSYEKAKAAISKALGEE
ncbi:hypothetical protein ABKT63_18045 [Enterobacter hormaechei]